MSIVPDLHVALAEQATAMALELQLGLRDQQGGLQHCPLTLVPWQIPQAHWQQAQAAARGVGLRLARLAADATALHSALQPILGGTSLPARLWQTLQAVPQSRRQAHAVNLMRVDLLQDIHQQWKLVEANTIAAGMGPFSEGLVQLQQALWPELQQAGWVDQEPHWVPDPVTAAIADALQVAAQQQALRVGLGNGLTVVLVVEPHEDNIFDQRKVAHALQRRGIRVLRRTLEQLDAQLERSAAPACRLRDAGLVHVLYFRTGYNLADYQDHHQHVTRLLQLRGELETLQVALAPTIALQLASAKAVQLHWFEQPEQDAATAALGTPQCLLPQCPETVRPDWNQWLLKSQGEGGGNVVQGEQIPVHIAMLSAAQRHDWLLMQKIPLTPRRELVPVLRRGQIQMAQDLVSELGVFLTGEALAVGGYLLRSKPAHALETGVHRGEGVIDTLSCFG